MTNPKSPATNAGWLVQVRDPLLMGLCMGLIYTAGGTPKLYGKIFAFEAQLNLFIYLARHTARAYTDYFTVVPYAYPINFPVRPTSHELVKTYDSPKIHVL